VGSSWGKVVITVLEKEEAVSVFIGDRVCGVIWYISQGAGALWVMGCMSGSDMESQVRRTRIITVGAGGPEEKLGEII